MTHITCECGSFVTKKYHPNHMKTKKHKTLMEEKKQITEISPKKQHNSKVLPKKQEITKVFPKKQEIEEIEEIQTIETPDEKNVKSCFALISIVENNGIGGIIIDKDRIKELTKKIYEFSVIERASAINLYMAL